MKNPNRPIKFYLICLSLVVVSAGFCIGAFADLQRSTPSFSVEQWTVFAYFFSAFLIALTCIFMYNSYLANLKQNETEKEFIRKENSFKYMEKWQSPIIANSWMNIKACEKKCVENTKQCCGSPEDECEHAIYLSNYFEMISLAIQEGQACQDLLRNALECPYVRFVNTCEDWLIHYLKNKTKSTYINVLHLKNQVWSRAFQ